MRSSRQKLVSVVTIAVLGFVFACASTQETAKGHRHHHHRKHGGGSGKFNIQKIYGEAAVKQCAGNFASPKIEANADKSKVYVISSCCSEDACVKNADKGKSMNQPTKELPWSEIR